ncbi:MAG: hypothetical protein IJS39_05950 [Synergistaceae bacterium]|nr:hypothetical protein [Synergistaceae bacterium]
MSDDYVRKDLYDSNMAEIRSLIAESERHYRAMNETAEARTQAQIAEIRAVCDGLGDTLAAYADMTNKRIDDLIERDNAIHRRFDRFMNFMMLIAGIVGAVVAVTQLYMAFKG